MPQGPQDLSSQVFFFLNEGKLKEYITFRPTLNEWLKEHFKQKENDKKKKSWNTRKEEKVAKILVNTIKFP